MSDYETEEQQVEAIKDWWKENSKSVFLGVVLGVGGILSWRGWVSYEQNQAVEASDLYAQVADAAVADDSATVKSLSATLRDDHSGSAFASMASLMEARVDVQEGAFSEAGDRLQWVIDNASLEEMKVVARLRQARVLLADGKADEALKALPASVSPEFAGRAAEIRGDIHLAKGDIDAARNAYSEAQTQSQGNSLLGMKLDDLAVEIAEKTTAKEEG